MAYIIGQALGLVVTVQCIFGSFLKKKWQMLVNMMLMNLFMSLNYLLIGAIGSGFFLGLVAVIQSAISLIHTWKGTRITTAENVIFFIAYVACGIFGMVTAPGFVPKINWKNALELLPIVGSVLYMITVFVRDEQETRKYFLMNASVWTIYTAAILSTTFFAEILAVISTSIAMYKYRKKKQA